MEEKLLETSLLEVQLSEIDLDPGPFCLSFEFDLESLKASIERFGILNPPYLLRNSDDSFKVMAGYRKLLAVRELGWSYTDCRVLPDGFPPKYSISTVVKSLKGSSARAIFHRYPEMKQELWEGNSGKMGTLPVPLATR